MPARTKKRDRRGRRGRHKLIDDKQVVKLRESGMSVRDMAEKLKVSTTAIYNTLGRLNVGSIPGVVQVCSSCHATYTRPAFCDNCQSRAARNGVCKRCKMPLGRKDGESVCSRCGSGP